MQNNIAFLKAKLAIVIVFFSVSIQAQNSNVTLRAQLSFPGETLSNICGYVDSLGNEYALVGTSTGMSIVDVTNPSLPVKLLHISGSHSTWREIKVRGKYAYVTTEGGGGLQIVNLSSLPNTSGVLSKLVVVSGASTIHTLHIDNNFVYMYGSNAHSGGAVVANITDPWNPVYVGNYKNSIAPYIHDGYVRNDTLYGAHVHGGFFSVVNFSNKSNPITIATKQTPTNFTHNTWLSTDSKTLFTTDENNNSYLAAYNLSDLSNIQELDKIQATPGSGSIIHNTHIINKGGNDYAVTAWYTDGFTIVDAGRPQNLIQVGNYDTYSGSGPGLTGAWGVYPYLPSGTTVVSNIDEGLFVFTPSYVRACYLEGNVIDSITGLSLNGVLVEIMSTPASETSDISGDYKTGYAIPGTYSVQYSKAGYNTKIVTVNLAAGQVSIENVALSKTFTTVYIVHVNDSITASGISNAMISIKGIGVDTIVTSFSNGSYVFYNIPPGVYDLVVGKWGYITKCSQSITLTGNNVTTTLLRPGYSDDFTFNFGWTRTGTAASGLWERVVPVGTSNLGVWMNPNVDDSTDCSNLAYVTGNNNSEVPVNSYTIITSPPFDLTGLISPTINYSRWFYNAGPNGNANDLCFISLKGANSSVFLEVVDTTSAMSSWIKKSFLVSDFMPPSTYMQLELYVRDYSPDHVLEAGLDNFFISSLGTTVNTEELLSSKIYLSAYPNPFTNEITIKYDYKTNSNATLEIYDLTGRVVEHIDLSQAKGFVNINPEINAGIYFVKLINGANVSETIRLIKLK